MGSAWDILAGVVIFALIAGFTYHVGRLFERLLFMRILDNPPVGRFLASITAGAVEGVVAGFVPMDDPGFHWHALYWCLAAGLFVGLSRIVIPHWPTNPLDW